MSTSTILEMILMVVFGCLEQLFWHMAQKFSWRSGIVIEAKISAEHATSIQKVRDYVANDENEGFRMIAEDLYMTTAQRRSEGLCMICFVSSKPGGGSVINVKFITLK